MKTHPLIFTLLAALIAAAPTASLAQAAKKTLPPTANASTTDAKERNRLEELFIWKTSEELRLAPNEEQKFTEAIHQLNQRRKEANAKMDAALSALSAAKTKVEADKALTAHRAALKDMQAAQTAELDKLKPLLGSEKLAQYIVVKNSILEKLKTMLAQPAPQQAAVATPPSTSGTSMAPPAAPIQSK